MKPSDLARFLRASPFRACDGRCVFLDAFEEQFYSWLAKNGREPLLAWSRDRIKDELSQRHPVGPGSHNKIVIGNMSAETILPPRFVKLEDGRVRLERAK